VFIWPSHIRLTFRCCMVAHIEMRWSRIRHQSVKEGDQESELLRHLCLLGCRPQRHGQQPKRRGGRVTSALAARQLARRRSCPRRTAAAVPPARSSYSGRHLQTAEMAAAPLWQMSWVSSRKASGDIKSNRALVVHAQFSDQQPSGRLGSTSVMYFELATSMHSLRRLPSSADS